MSAPRKQAPRLARPAARYWKGKAPKGVAEVDSESDTEDEHLEVQEDGDVLIGGDQDIVDEYNEDEGLPFVQTVQKTAVKSMNFVLKDIDISKEARISRDAAYEQEESEEEEEEDEVEIKQEGSDEESSEDESSEEEESAKPVLRPLFVPKRSRVTIADKDALAEENEEFMRRREAEAEERRKQSHDLVAESIRRELLEKEKEGEVPDIDDFDGLDPEGEFEAWKLRELARIKRDKETEIRREEEREEIERRRALPEAVRMKEDTERAQKLREEKPKGQQKFLQKYWHKGAFHQDADILQKHDFTEATASTVDVSMLPKVMQVKNFGKRSRTKYTHLLDQDTTAVSGGFGGAAPVKAGGSSTDGGGCFLCGGPHMKKDCPQNTGPWNATKDRTGANSVGVGNGDRSWGGPPKDKSWRDGDTHAGERDSGGWRDRDYERPRYRDRDDDRGYSRRSRSPRPRRRSRSRSQERDRDREWNHRDKRRKVS